MSDFIKREDAIEALTAEFYITGRENARTILNYVDLVSTRIKAIPSADRPQGEWVDDDFVGQYRCSECDYYAIDEYDYCPNCGAHMKGADDE